MSFQAYIDAVESTTGKTPQQLLEIAAERGYTPTTKAAEVVSWLKDDYGVGRGHAMAFFHVLKNGATISDEHVDSGGSHSDPSAVLRLDGVAHRTATG